MFSCLVFWPSPVIPTHPQSSPVIPSHRFMTAARMKRLSRGYWRFATWQSDLSDPGDMETSWFTSAVICGSKLLKPLYIILYYIYIYIFRGKNLGDSAYLYWIKLDQNTNYCNHKHIHDASYDWVLGIKVGGTGYWVLGHLGLYKHTLLGALQHVYII